MSKSYEIIKVYFGGVKGGHGWENMSLHWYHTFHSKAIRFTLAMTLQH